VAPIFESGNGPLYSGICCGNSGPGVAG